MKGLFPYTEKTVKISILSFVLMVSAQFDDDLNALEGLVNSQNDQNGNSDLDVNILEDLVKLQENNNGNDNNDLNVLEDLGNV